MKLSATQWKALIVALATFTVTVVRIFVPHVPEFDFTQAIEILAGVLVGGALLPQPKGASK